LSEAAAKSASSTTATTDAYRMVAFVALLIIIG